MRQELLEKRMEKQFEFGAKTKREKIKILEVLYYLPFKSLKSMNRKYLGEIGGSIHCPSRIDRITAPLDFRPELCLLFCLFEAHAQSYNIGIDFSRIPSRDWLVACLNSMNPDHRFIDELKRRTEILKLLGQQQISPQDAFEDYTSVKIEPNIQERAYLRNFLRDQLAEECSKIEIISLVCAGF